VLLCSVVLNRYWRIVMCQGFLKCKPRPRSTHHKWGTSLRFNSWIINSRKPPCWDQVEDVCQPTSIYLDKNSTLVGLLINIIIPVHRRLSNRKWLSQVFSPNEKKPKYMKIYPNTLVSIFCQIFQDIHGMSRNKIPQNIFEKNIVITKMVVYAVNLIQYNCWQQLS